MGQIFLPCQCIHYYLRRKGGPLSPTQCPILLLSDSHEGLWMIEIGIQRQKTAYYSLQKVRARALWLLAVMSVRWLLHINYEYGLHLYSCQLHYA